MEDHMAGGTDDTFGKAIDGDAGPLFLRTKIYLDMLNCPIMLK